MKTNSISFYPSIKNEFSQSEIENMVYEAGLVYSLRQLTSFTNVS